MNEYQRLVNEDQRWMNEDQRLIHEDQRWINLAIFSLKVEDIVLKFMLGMTRGILD